MIHGMGQLSEQGVRENASMDTLLIESNVRWDTVLDINVECKTLEIYNSKRFTQIHTN